MCGVDFSGKMALQKRVGGHDRILREHPTKLRTECSRLTQAGKLLNRIFHYDGKADEQPNPNNHWQNGGAANRGVQLRIVGDGVEFRDDRADQAPRQLRLISNRLGSGTATKHQQPQRGCGRDLENFVLAAEASIVPSPALASSSNRPRGVGPALSASLHISGKPAPQARQVTREPCSSSEPRRPRRPA